MISKKKKQGSLVGLYRAKNPFPKRDTKKMMFERLATSSLGVLIPTKYSS